MDNLEAYFSEPGEDPNAPRDYVVAHRYADLPDPWRSKREVWSAFAFLELITGGNLA